MVTLTNSIPQNWKELDSIDMKRHPDRFVIHADMETGRDELEPHQHKTIADVSTPWTGLPR